jgi:hypothetical protein
MVRRRRLIATGFAVVALLTIAYGLLRGAAAAGAAQHGKSALVDAQQRLDKADLVGAIAELRGASSDFALARRQLRALGPLRPIARAIPFVRVQVRGVETFAHAGELLSAAGIRLATAGSALTNPSDPNVPVSSALSSLRSVQGAMDDGLRALDTSITEVAKLNGYRLLGPLGTAHRDLVTRLPIVRARAARADAGLRAFLEFAGANGDRRYLIVSQNPDEPRPTGGFIGTYGVVAATGKGIALERYGPAEEWSFAPDHSAARVASADAPAPFRIVTPASNQLLLNVNATPDWPTSAELASSLWTRGGERPVDGVLSFTPDSLARLLGVLGSVEVPDFGETVTSANVIERTDFHTHHDPADAGAGGRKRFISSLVGVVINRALQAPAHQWLKLGQAMAASFDARESLAWSSHPEVQSVVDLFGWDGRFIGADGDFVGVSEFEYAAKNGRALRRTYDHHVVLRSDGSGTVDMTVTVSDPAPFDPIFNVNSQSYVVLYGPRRALLANGTRATDAEEPNLAGHPAAGWLLAATPGGTDTSRVVWEVPDGLLARGSDGSMRYSLTWWHLPAHTGDIVHLRVDPPEGWRWAHSAPPSVIQLKDRYQGSWQLVRN